MNVVGTSGGFGSLFGAVSSLGVQATRDMAGTSRERTLNRENDQLSTENTQLKTENRSLRTENGDLKSENRDLKTEVRNLGQDLKAADKAPTGGQTSTGESGGVSGNPLVVGYRNVARDGGGGAGGLINAYA